MFAIVNNKGEIIEEFHEYNNIRELRDGERILEAPFELPIGVLRDVARVYKGQIVPKMVVEITLNKKIVRADGEDEIMVSVELLDRQPDEIISSVTLDIEGAKIPVQIENDKGSMVFSTTKKGVFTITADMENVICLKRWFEAK